MEQFFKYAGVNQMICTISRNMRTLYLVCEVFNYLVIQYFLNIKKYVFYQVLRRRIVAVILSYFVDAK